MKLQRFFCEDKIGDKGSVVITNPSLINQIKNVFRFRVGDKVALFDNSGYDFLAMIDSVSQDSISMSIVEVNKNVVLPIRETYLFASIIKKDNFEWIAQKAVELGVSHIVPIFSERSEKKDLNFDRIKKIIIEAAEQSGRGTLPVLSEIIDLESALSSYSHVKSIAWHPLSTKFVSQDVSDAIGAYIGPEGGWSQEEIDMFMKHNIPVRSLGPQILRSETAVVSVISLLVF